MDFSTLEPTNQLIITASNRQARFIQKQYQDWQIAAGKSTWDALEVLPWNAFVDKCWSLAEQFYPINKPMPQALSKAQSFFLWQQLVEQSSHTDALLNIQQTANSSYEAWRLLAQWQVNDFSFVRDDLDQEAFAEWNFEFKKQLEKNHWLEFHQIANWLAENSASFAGYLPKNVAIYGFEQITPQQKGLFEQLKQQVQLNVWKLAEEPEAMPQVFCYADPEQELVAATRWAKEKLKQQPQQNIAIVVPNLEQNQSLLQRIIARELYPEEFIKGARSNQWHDISTGISLDQNALIKLLLSLLGLVAGRVSKAELQHLLLTPYVYATKDDSYRASQFELLIRKSNREYYNVTVLKDLCLSKDYQLTWLSKVDEWKQLCEGKSFSYREFIAEILKLLESLHWTGYEALSSFEYQLQKAFLEQLKASASLNRIASKQFSWQKNLAILKHYLSQQSFHQESPKAPLKVMGLLEAIGLQFDAVWLCSLTDKVLPENAQANPFLSKPLQLKYQMPGSSPQREMHYAKSILQSLLVNKELVFSYASFEQDQEQRLSPLVDSLFPKLTTQEVPAIKLQPEFIHEWPLNSSLELYQDLKGTALEQEERARGGTGLIKVQAASPFDAYCRYRLGLKPLEQDPLGISFMERGNIFHKVMQMLWLFIKTQKALLNYSVKDLEKLVDNYLTTVLNIESKHLYLLNNPKFLAVEKQRLKALVMESLQLDKERPEFEVIECEAKRKIEVGGLILSITIDRIDRLADGSLIIIDYKTGIPKLMDLFNEPIGEPQLLLYAISEHKEASPVAGILFYQAHLRASRYVGFTESTEMIAGVKALVDLAQNPYADQFAEAVEEWRDMLNSIGHDFKEGNAELTDYSVNYSDHYPISRWQERSEYDIASLVSTQTSTGDRHE